MYNSILEKIILPFGDLLMGSSYIQQLKYWRKVDDMSAEQLSQLQQENLSKLLQHAAENVPFYKNHLSSTRRKDISLSDFPVIDKFTIRNKSDDLLTEGVSKSSLIPYSE